MSVCARRAHRSHDSSMRGPRSSHRSCIVDCTRSPRAPPSTTLDDASVQRRPWRDCSAGRKRRRKTVHGRQKAPPLAAARIVCRSASDLASPTHPDAVRLPTFERILLPAPRASSNAPQGCIDLAWTALSAPNGCTPAMSSRTPTAVALPRRRL